MKVSVGKDNHHHKDECPHSNSSLRREGIYKLFHQLSGDGRSNHDHTDKSACLQVISRNTFVNTNQLLSMKDEGVLIGFTCKVFVPY